MCLYFSPLTNEKCVNNAHFSVILLNNFQGPTIRLWYVSLERMIPVSAALRPLRMMLMDQVCLLKCLSHTGTAKLEFCSIILRLLSILCWKGGHFGSNNINYGGGAGMKTVRCQSFTMMINPPVILCQCQKKAWKFQSLWLTFAEIEFWKPLCICGLFAMIDKNNDWLILLIYH